MYSSEAIIEPSSIKTSLGPSFTEVTKPLNKNIPDLVYSTVVDLEQTTTEVAPPYFEEECEHSSTIDYKASIEPLIDTFQHMLMESAQKICKDLGSEFDIDLQGNIKIVLNDGCKHRLVLSIYESQKCPHSVECKTPINSVDIL